MYSQRNTPVSLQMNLHGLGKRAGSYHIHEYPVPVKTDARQMVCSGSSVSGHFNPHMVDKSAGPGDAEGTADLYEVCGNLRNVLRTFPYRKYIKS